MILLADYEGLGVSIALLMWLIVTVPALLLALTGIILATYKIRRFRLPIWMGAVACLVELGMAALVWMAFFDEQTRLGEHAERFRPGMLFWLLFAGTVALALLSVWLGRTHAGPKEPHSHQAGKSS